MAEILRSLTEKYKKSVSENPDTIGQIETTFRVLSYIVAGRFQDSQVISELMFSASNLLVLMNDAILKGAAKIEQISPLSQERVMRFLTVLEYVEVFVEMAALKLSGTNGRWFVIVCIQIAKAVFRFVLLGRYKAGIQPTPPILPLNRDMLTNNTKEQKQESGSSVYKLQRSGKNIRSLESAPPLRMRDWKLPTSPPSNTPSLQKTMLAPTPLNRHRVWAEGLHIIKPLVHLTSLYKFGTSSWKPWILSCGLDVASLSLMGEPTDLNVNEKGELRRRTFMLMFYLLRSPFYDRYSQAKIIFLLKILADNVPGISLLISEYICLKVYHYYGRWRLAEGDRKKEL